MIVVTEWEDYCILKIEHKLHMQHDIVVAPETLSKPPAIIMWFPTPNN